MATEQDGKPDDSQHRRVEVIDLIDDDDEDLEQEDLAEEEPSAAGSVSVPPPPVAPASPPASTANARPATPPLRTPAPTMTTPVIPAPRGSVPPPRMVSVPPPPPPQVTPRGVSPSEEREALKQAPLPVIAQPSAIASPVASVPQEPTGASVALSSLRRTLPPMTIPMTPLDDPDLAPPTAQSTFVERIARERESLTSAQPTRAAMSLAASAIASWAHAKPLDQESVSRANSLSKEDHLVAWTARLLTEQAGASRETVNGLLRRELTLVSGHRERVALLLRLGTAELQDSALEQAERLAREAATLDPKDPSAWELLATALLRRRNHKDAVLALASMADSVDDPALRSVGYACAASVREATTDDVVGTIALFRKSVEAHAGHLSAWAALERLHLRAGSYADHARTLIAQGAQCDHAQTASELFGRAGDVFFWVLQDGRTAIRCYEHSYSLDPSTSIALEKLLTVHESMANYALIPACIERLLRTATGAPMRAALLCSAGEVFCAHLDQLEDGIATFRRALDHHPTYAPALSSLAALYLRANRLDEYAAIRQLEADRMEDSRERASVLASLAELHEAQLANVDTALDLYERAFDADPQNLAALDGIERLLRRRNELAALRFRYERAMEVCSDASRKRALAQALAALCLELGDTQQSVALLLDCAKAPPDHAYTLLSLARAQALHGDWQGHAATLSRQAEITTDPHEQARLFHRIATVLEVRGGDRERALAAWQKLLTKQPRHEVALHAVARIHSAAGRWDDAASAERSIVQQMEAGALCAVRWLWLGRIYEKRLGKQDKAIEAYDAAISMDPELFVARIALERLLRSNNRVPRLIELCEQQAERASVSANRRASLVRAARLAELLLQDSVKAQALYDRAASASPDPSDALWGSLRLHESKGTWPKVEQRLLSLLELAPTPITRMRVLLRLSRLYEQRLHALPKAAACLEDAIETHSAAAMHALDRLRLARIDGAPDVLAKWMGRVADVTSDRRLARAMLVAKGHVLGYLDDPASATAARESFAQALVLDPKASAAIEGLLRGEIPAPRDVRIAGWLRSRSWCAEHPALRAGLALAAANVHTLAGRTSEALDDLETVLVHDPRCFDALEASRMLREQRREYTAALSLARSASATATSPANAADIALDAAMLLAGPLGQEEDALEAGLEVLATQPSHDGAFALCTQLLTSSGRYAELHEVLRRHGEAIANGPEKTAIFLRAASLAEHSLGEPRVALDNLVRADRSSPRDERVLERLAQVHSKLLHWAEALSAWGALLSLNVDPKTQRRATLARAAIWMDELPDFVSACVALAALYAGDPGDREVASALARAKALSGDGRAAQQLFADLASSAPNAEERVRCYYAKADIERFAMHDEAQWHATTAKVVSLALEAPEILPMVEAFCDREDAWETFVQQGEEAIVHAGPSRPGALALRASMARASGAKLNDTAGAEQQWTRAIAEFPRAIEPRLARVRALGTGSELLQLQDLRVVLEIDPTCADAFVLIAQAQQRVGNVIGAGIAATSALLLGASDPSIEAIAAAAVAPPPRADALSADEALRVVVGESNRGALTRIMTALDPHLGELFPAKLEALRGYTKAPENVANVQVFRTILRSLAAPSAHLYRGRDKEIHVAPSLPPTLVLGSDYFLDSALPYFIFQCAVFASRAAANALVARIASSEELVALIEAVLDLNKDEPVHRELRKRVNSVLPRKTRKDIERWVEESPLNVAVEVPQWEHQETLRSLRLGLVFARDLRVVAQILVPEAFASADLTERRKLLASSKWLADLLRFSASTECSLALEQVFATRSPPVA
ncbi:MAG: hypothetical protein Q8Q09_20635 [Deltaproteobacteria bacterium]|nr:hypothetical protein [Deltaproteobacteria bacterium]